MVGAWDDVFEGFDKVPWSSMGHAYGPADDVLTEVPLLASDDAEERENALGFLWGCVHHQGDIYDSTIAVVPFLVRAAVEPGFPDRAGIIELLGSIAGYSAGRGGFSEPEPEEAGWRRYVRQAYDGVMAGTPGFLAALQDSDASVRGAAVDVLKYCRRERGSIMAALREALAGERDPDVQVALINAYLIVSSEDLYSATSIDEPARRWLLDLLAAETDPAHLRLAALVQIAERIPERLPADVVGLALGLVEAIYAEAEDPDSASPAFGLLRSLHLALGERVGDRIVLITSELDAGRPDRAENALRTAQWLMRDHRADYAELVRRIGGFVAHPEPSVCMTAVYGLDALYELAAPAADAIAALLDTAPREVQDGETDGVTAERAWIVHEAAGPRLGRFVSILARTRDPRAVPILRRCLENPTPIRDLGQAIGAVGPAAAQLAGPIRERISRLSDRDRAGRAHERLAYALGRIGPAAVSAAPELTAMLDDDRANFAAATALGTLGPAVAAAPGVLDGLRRMLDHPDQRTAVNAAAALARISPDDALPRPLFERVLIDPDARPTLAAAEGLALLGTRSGGGSGDTSDALLARLDDMLDGTDFWAWLTAAIALWYTTGDAARAVPAMERAWTKAHYTRTRIAHYAAEMGPAAAALEPVLRTELAAVRRHNRPVGSSGYSSMDIPADEALLREVRHALAEITRS